MAQEKLQTIRQGEFFSSVNHTSRKHGYGVYKVGNHAVLRKIYDSQDEGLQYIFKNAFSNTPDTPFSEKIVQDLKQHFPGCIPQ